MSVDAVLEQRGSRKIGHILHLCVLCVGLVGAGASHLVCQLTRGVSKSRRHHHGDAGELSARCACARCGGLRGALFDRSSCDFHLGVLSQDIVLWLKTAQSVLAHVQMGRRGGALRRRRMMWQRTASTFLSCVQSICATTCSTRTRTRSSSPGWWQRGVTFPRCCCTTPSSSQVCPHRPPDCSLPSLASSRLTRLAWMRGAPLAGTEHVVFERHANLSGARQDARFVDAFGMWHSHNNFQASLRSQLTRPPPAHDNRLGGLLAVHSAERRRRPAMRMNTAGI